MNERDASPIGFFQKYLTVWVILCMAVGICVGKFLPQIPEFLNRFEYARVSIPMAILIWVMIYPMMMKVDFRSIKNVVKNPKGLFVVIPLKLAVAVAVALFGTTSPAALATTVGVLTEVPVMLFLVKIANKTKGRFPA